MVRFDLDHLYLSMIQHGGAKVTDDLADLRAEYPAWDFDTSWITVGSGPDVRRIWAWPPDGGPALTASDADEIRRKIGQATR